MVTSVAHVWFNTFFEGQGPENEGVPDDSGVFELEWDAMDGLKGSSRKGTRAFDKFALVWKAVDASRKSRTVVDEPKEGEEVEQTEAADWRGEYGASNTLKKLGLRADDSGSESVSRASSVQSKKEEDDWNGSEEELKGVKSDVVHNTASDPQLTASAEPEEPERRANNANAIPEIKIESVDDDVVQGMSHLSTSNLPDGQHATDLEEREEHTIGSIDKDKG